MAVAKIWRKIPEHYNLMGSRCAKCQALFFPEREICLSCGAHEKVPYKFSGKGTIVTYSVIRTPIADPEGENTEVVSREIPYNLAIIKLEEGPMLTAQVVDCVDKDMKIGLAVEVVFRKLLERGEHGVIQYGYKFRLKR